jgi:glycerol-3-phosphate dehydrogenase
VIPLTADAEVAVIGAGVVGLTIAYRLSKLGRKVVVIEKEREPGLGVTAGQANVIHVVQLPFGSLKSRLARRGNLMYDKLCTELGVKLSRMPALLVVRGWSRVPALLVVYLYLRLKLKGEFAVRLRGSKWLRAREPVLSDSVTGGIVVDGYGTIDAGALVSGLRSASEQLGAVFRFGWEAMSFEPSDGTILVRTSGGDIRTRFVVNAAGLYSDDLSRALGKDLGLLEPGLGVMAVYTGMKLGSIVAPLPLSIGSRTKGGAIIPATDGTTIIGPTLRPASSKEDRAYNQDDLALLDAKFGPLLKGKGALVRAYVGVRPLSPTRDFIIDFDAARKVVSLVGIESPGLTAAPAIAETVERMVEEALS